MKSFILVSIIAIALACDSCSKHAEAANTNDHSHGGETLKFWTSTADNSNDQSSNVLSGPNVWSSKTAYLQQQEIDNNDRSNADATLLSGPNVWSSKNEYLERLTAGNSGFFTRQAVKAPQVSLANLEQSRA